MQKADPGKRIIAFIVDCIVSLVIMLPFFVLMFLPGIGGIFPLLGGLASLAYFALRDALPKLDGSSLGKHFL